MNNKKSPTSN